MVNLDLSRTELRSVIVSIKFEHRTVDRADGKVSDGLKAEFVVYRGAHHLEGKRSLPK